MLNKIVEVKIEIRLNQKSYESKEFQEFLEVIKSGEMKKQLSSNTSFKMKSLEIDCHIRNE